MPNSIDDQEKLHSFLSEDDLNKKKRIKWERFFPDDQGKTSVCRTEGGHELRDSGEVYARIRKRTLAGWASLTAVTIRDQELQVSETPGDYPGHCDIHEWPQDREARQLLCTELALWTAILLLPVGERTARE